MTGRRVGATIAFGWLAGLAITVGARDRIISTLRGGAFDEWLALLTLVALFAGCWWAGRRLRASESGSGSSSPASCSTAKRSKGLSSLNDRMT